MTDGDDQARIRDQIEFYRAHALQGPPGREDPGVQELLRAYFEDPALEAIVQTHCPPSARCLELGSGPGRWTGPLLDVCQHVTAIDISAELHEVSRSRHGKERVDYVVADLFEYQPDDRYDLIFAGYWLSHVPAGRFQPFWSMVRDALAPGGHVVMVDDGIRDDEGTVRFAEDPTGGGEQRRLPDGREFTIVKVAYAPRDLEARLAAIGWRATVTVLPPANYVLGAQPN
ncbi:MAG TPA: class I SAM-dependent methyltransferase [Acidimicrobiia bacterium]|jgi:demethylmenaquinone methyltransferase/2-methoxy-6-polyprenyl-1,4-benzoquinol methylase